MDHNLNHIVGHLQKGIFANCSTNNCDRFNDLASELLVLWLEELVEELDQELEGLFEVRNEMLLRLFHCARKGCCCVFFNQRSAVLDQQAKFLRNWFHVRQNDFFVGSLHEVGEGSAGMGLYSGDCVVEAVDNCWQHNSGEAFLEVFWKIISELPKAVQAGVSNLWVWVVAVLNNYWDHDCQLLGVVNVFANLTEGHNASVFVAPVRIIGDRVLDKLTDKR